ncbi:MAG: BolA/IbaG family iron-sulfur metabolism protein [Pseudomonadota bacterium]
MQQQEVVALIQRAFADARILVEGEDCSFSVVVITPDFDGMGLLQRQKAVLATVREPLASGAVHAMTVKAYTPEQWEALPAQAPGGLTVL